MKKAILLLSAIFAVTALQAQQTIKSDGFENFRAVSLSGKINVELIPGDTNRIDVTLHETDLKRFKWSVSEGVLSANLRPTSGRDAHATIRLQYATPLREITVTGANLTTTEYVESDMLKISVSGGASANIDVETLDLELNVTGNSMVMLKGGAKYFTMHATEKSKADSREMECVAANVDTATGAEVYVTASERLVTSAKTSSTIFYMGNPTIFKDRSPKMNVMGSGVLNIGR